MVDVNLLSYLLIKGPQTKAAERAYARDRRWISPRLHRYEFLNVLSSNCRFHGMSRDHAMALWKRANRIIPGFSTEPDPLEVLKTFITLSLTTYDSEYVVLAQMRKLRLVTSDKDVLKALPDIAVSIEDFASGK